MYNILVCDDEREIVDAIEIYLMQEGYQIFKAYDGEEAIEVLKKQEIHLLIMDIMMPKLDGIRATMKIREKYSIPIIFLSAKSQDADKILGLNIGADDYIVKPFEPVEVLARINAHLRREENKSQKEDLSSSSEVEVDNLKVNMDTYEVKLNNELITDLKPKEIQLLYFFMTNKNQVFTREQLLDKVWGYEYFGGTRTVDVHIKSVREKLSSDKNKWEIKTIWNVGYKFEIKV